MSLFRKLRAHTETDTETETKTYDDADRRVYDEDKVKNVAKVKPETTVRLIIICLLPITVLLNLLSQRYPGITEKIYFVSIDKAMREGLSIVTGWLPFSFGEFLVIILVIVLAVLVINALIKLFKFRTFYSLLTIAAYLSALYILFMLLWGFNYNRYSFDKISGLKVEKSSKEELYSLCDKLISRANGLRGMVDEDSRGVMTIKGGYKSVFSRAYLGYKNASGIYQELGGSYGPPKPVLLSEMLCYTGITGIYMPYTGEANVNIKITDFMLPATATHEMAHQRGFAREDEANYIGYLTCSLHPDKDFQYSGVMLAVIYSMDALYNADPTAYKTLSAKYSPAVLRDLRNEADFWDKYKGKVEKISSSINDSYLKSNGQKDGVESYGRMVDLLIAEYRNKK